jgi:hypothetical protein
MLGRMSTTTPNLLPTGMFCQRLQCSHDTVVQTLAKLGIEPALRLNSVAYFDEKYLESVGAVIDHERQSKTKRGKK